MMAAVSRRESGDARDRASLNPEIAWFTNSVRFHPDAAAGQAESSLAVSGGDLEIGEATVDGVDFRAGNLEVHRRFA